MRKNKLLAGFFLFLGFMGLCSIISKSVYTTKLPMVSTVLPEGKYVEHRVEAEGLVVAGGEVAVTTLGNMRVASIEVQEGQQVLEGDLLFQIDLEDLKLQLASQETEIAKLNRQICTIRDNQGLRESQKALQEERAREDYDLISRLEDTDVGRAMDRYAKAVEALEDYEHGGDFEPDGEEHRALQEAVQNAAYGEADAKRERDQAVKEAGRTVEDILQPQEEDAALSLYQLEMASLQKKQKAYQEILENQGLITASHGGVVTRLNLTVGGRTTDTAALLLSDQERPCQFKAVLTAEQKRYISLRDTVTLKLEGSRERDLSVEYLTESRTQPGKFEVLLTLPKEAGTPGASGVLFRSEQGERHRCCVPSQVVYKSENRSYVYVLKEREGILGEEYYVEEVTVRVLDENERWTALEEGSIGQDAQIIVSASKEIKNGDTVRWSSVK